MLPENSIESGECGATGKLFHQDSLYSCTWTDSSMDNRDRERSIESASVMENLKMFMQKKGTKSVNTENRLRQEQLSRRCTM